MTGRRVVRGCVATWAAAMFFIPGAGGIGATGLAAQEPAVDLEELAARATPAVVSIEVRVGDRSRQGSGFLVDAGGLIITNSHVLRDATSASVRLASGDVYDRVAILARDERRDIAILRIPGFGLPSLPLGNSDSVRIGAPAIAIGSPLGLDNTVSTGIVSGRRQEPEGYQFLQITAPASSGSSGGPVLSRDGRVIGIAAAQLRNGQNLNFAVPINYARGLLSQVGEEPLAVLSAETPPPTGALDRTADVSDSVNRGLVFDLSEVAAYRLDLAATVAGGSLRHTRITLRPLRDVVGGGVRLERYFESETTIPRGETAPPSPIRRERSRTIVGAADLRPLSARGQIDVLIDGEWRRRSYDLRFEDDRVRGTIRDSAGIITQVDRALPPGIVIREMRDFAFGALVADPMIGRSIELVTFDPWTVEVTNDRFDVRGRTDVEIRGETHEALAVDLASGLTNERAYFTVSSPRTLLRRLRADDGIVEEVTGFLLLPPPDDGSP